MENCSTFGMVIKPCPAPQNEPVFDVPHPPACKQTAAGSHHSSEGSECPLDARLNGTPREPVPQHVPDGRGIVLGGGSCSHDSVCSAAPRQSSKGAAWLTNEVIEAQLPSLRLGFSQGSSASFPASIPSSVAPALSSTHPLRSLHSNHPLLSLSRP